MTPIINPWAIYLISRLDTIKDVIDFISFVIFLCVAGITLERYIATETTEKWIEYMKKSCVKKLCIIVICLSAINSFIPDTRTGFMIFTSHYATEENINKGIEFIEKTTDYIIDKTKELKDN